MSFDHGHAIAQSVEQSIQPERCHAVGFLPTSKTTKHLVTTLCELARDVGRSWDAKSFSVLSAVANRATEVLLY